ncbi:hypothetical protein ACIA49_32965 [Kribbella sp. NPDC051587]|uniref:restriction endonuclease-related protein n=1 Tax=Kribbella sp. NPDC051587 TaxID=3364119 RepID=UPI003790FA7C
MTAALRASVAWSQRADQPDAWREVARMAGVIMNIHGLRQQIRTPMELVSALQRPVGELLETDTPDEALDALVLLDEDGCLSEGALDVATDYTFALFDGDADPASTWLPAWAWQRDEQVERALFQSLRAAGDQAVYTATRRFLIDRPAGQRRHLIDERNTSPAYAGAKAVAEYLDIPKDRRHRPAGSNESYWWPCPVCQWPMQVRDNAVFCTYSPHEARFILDAGPGQPARLRKASSARLKTPKAAAVAGAVCVDPAVWRFVTVPGLPEIALTELESTADGISIQLWPVMDTFDALVEIAGVGRWTVDVKDHVSVRRIVDDPPAAQHVVVPDYRRSQIPRLRRSLAGKTIWTVREFMKHVRAVAAGGETR